MRVCVATGVYLNPGATQVNRHVRSLFGGNTVVLSETTRTSEPNSRPHLAWREMPPRENRLIEFAFMARSILQHRTARVPYGARRRMIQNFLQENKVEAVLCEFGTIGLRIAPVVNEIGIPVFSYFRGADASHHLREPLRVAGYRRMMPRLAGVFSVSQFLLDQLANHGVQHEASFVIPSGVDTDLFAPAEKTPGKVLAVGRFIEKKRPDITVKAFCAIARDFPAARLDMIGDGPMLEQCKAIADQSGFADRVVFHGWQPHDVVREHLSRTKVFVQHSVTAPNGDTEGLPTSIQEAMACGAVIVSTQHAGIPHVVKEGKTGFLVDEHDETGFSEKMARALAETDETQRMSIRARELACTELDNRKLLKIVEQKIVELSLPRSGSNVGI